MQRYCPCGLADAHVVALCRGVLAYKEEWGQCAGRILNTHCSCRRLDVTKAIPIHTANIVNNTDCAESEAGAAVAEIVAHAPPDATSAQLVDPHRVMVFLKVTCLLSSMAGSDARHCWQRLPGLRQRADMRTVSEEVRLLVKSNVAIAHLRCEPS